MWSFISLVVVGAIMGALARLFMKGDQNLGILWTIILGALGALAGGWIADSLFDGSTIVTWIAGVVLAIVFITIFIAVRGRAGRAAR
ncbi:GlsB/YeaQ/YmgE family stress response membrane protein [Georgenia sp. Z1344]|uniref:GlsB/YeaQ/YmgE family stress response membrane protein n=1 Tax=Georgenia sp. Z1344 TaxID=3416706 RepID=UPI003CF0CE74